MATQADARRICTALPGAEEGSERLGFGVAGKGFCWTWMERVLPKRARVANPEVLAIAMPGLGAKEVLLGSRPAWAVADPHYDGYPAVLVRLAAIGVEELEALLIEGWRAKAPKRLVALSEGGGYGWDTDLPVD